MNLIDKTFNTKDTRRISSGLEYYFTQDEDAFYWTRLPLRLGFYHQTCSQENLKEIFLTLGTSIPFSQDNGTLDLSLEVGRRGNIDEFNLEEDIIRCGIAISGYEKWGKRKK